MAPAAAPGMVLNDHLVGAAETAATNPLSRRLQDAGELALSAKVNKQKVREGGKSCRCRRQTVAMVQPWAKS